VGKEILVSEKKGNTMRHEWALGEKVTFEGCLSSVGGPALLFNTTKRGTNKNPTKEGDTSKEIEEFASLEPNTIMGMRNGVAKSKSGLPR